MHHIKVIKGGNVNNVVKEQLVDGVQYVDYEPRKGSLNGITSDAVANVAGDVGDVKAVIPEGTTEVNPLVNEAGLGEVSSNIAPAYTKKTYDANSYVMHEGVLYTNPNAIDTAEDWTPAHWTQTTVAEMMAGAGGVTWTNRIVALNIDGASTDQAQVQDHEFVTLTVTHTGNNTTGILDLHLHGECYVRLNKAYRVAVQLLIDDAQPTNIINTGIASLDKSSMAVLCINDSNMPDEYDPESFATIYALGDDTRLELLTPSPEQTSPMELLLHSLGDGTIIITPLEV